MDFADLRSQLAGVDWRPVFGSNDPGEQTAYLVQHCLAVMDTVAPVRTVKLRNPSAPPISTETKQLMSQRCAALARGDQSRYKELNRLTRSAIRRDDIRRRIREAGPATACTSVCGQASQTRGTDQTILPRSVQTL